VWAICNIGRNQVNNAGSSVKLVMRMAHGNNQKGENIKNSKKHSLIYVQVE
jgi:hypothetical protein